MMQLIGMAQLPETNSRAGRAGWALGASGGAALSGDDITLDEVERTRI